MVNQIQNETGWWIPPPLTRAVEEELGAGEVQRAVQAQQAQSTAASPAAQQAQLSAQAQAVSQDIATTSQSLAATTATVAPRYLLSSLTADGTVIMGGGGGSGGDPAINEKQALLDLQRSQLDPDYADQQLVFQAQHALNVARSAEYQVQLQQLEAKRSELAALTAAQDNIANQAAVAAGRRDQGIYDSRYAMAGLGVQEIYRPLDGNGGNTDLPPGVRFALESDAERQQRLMDRSSAQRGVELDAASLATTNAQLALAQQQLLNAKNDAARKLAEDRAQMNVSQAQLNDAASGGGGAGGVIETASGRSSGLIMTKDYKGGTVLGGMTAGGVVL